MFIFGILIINKLMSAYKNKKISKNHNFIFKKHNIQPKVGNMLSTNLQFSGSCGLQSTRLKAYKPIYNLQLFNPFHLQSTS